MKIGSGSKLLYIGDSITDAGRRQDPHGLGHGYVRYLVDLFTCRHPELDVAHVNAGVSGDTIRYLEARWAEDVIDQKPDFLSISIGVNDVWRQLQTPRNPDEVMIDEFEATYRKLLHQTRDAVGCGFFLCEPTVNGETRDTPYNKLTGPYIECVHRLAEEFDATLVPMNAAFWKVIDADPSRKWTADGVHPLQHGHMLMALTLLEALERA